LLITGFGYAVTQLFGPTYFSWTSNLGNISLLFACTVLVQLVQDDLTLAKAYLDFLEKSNNAFDSRESEIEMIDEYIPVQVDGEAGDVEMVEAQLKPPLQIKFSLGAMYPDALNNNIPLVTPKSSDHMRSMRRTGKPFSDSGSSVETTSQKSAEKHSNLSTPRVVLENDETDSVGRGVV
jgi:hypothetical protein